MYILMKGGGGSKSFSRIEPNYYFFLDKIYILERDNENLKLVCSQQNIAIQALQVDTKEGSAHPYRLQKGWQSPPPKKKKKFPPLKLKSPKNCVS